MAVMDTCCCCGVRSGSIASAIYSLVLAIIGLIYFGRNALSLTIVTVCLNNDGYNASADPYKGIWNAFYASYIIACIVFVFMIIACILVLVGVSQDSKGKLIPFMVAQGLHLLWYILIFAVDAAFLDMVNDIWAGGYYLALIILLIPFFIGDLVCLLCVFSQYQEYNEGRGRATDQPGAAQTNTTVVIHYTGQAQAPPSYKL